MTATSFAPWFTIDQLLKELVELAELVDAGSNPSWACFAIIGYCYY